MRRKTNAIVRPVNGRTGNILAAEQRLAESPAFQEIQILFLANEIVVKFSQHEGHFGWEARVPHFVKAGLAEILQAVLIRMGGELVKIHGIVDFRHIIVEQEGVAVAVENPFGFLFEQRAELVGFGLGGDQQFQKRPGLAHFQFGVRKSARVEEEHLRNVAGMWPPGIAL